MGDEATMRHAPPPWMRRRASHCATAARRSSAPAAAAMPAAAALQAGVEETTVRAAAQNPARIGRYDAGLPTELSSQSKCSSHRGMPMMRKYPKSV